MNDKDASAAIAALTIAFHELVVALGKTEAVNVSTLAATIDQRARTTQTNDQTKAHLLSISKKMMNP